LEKIGFGNGSGSKWSNGCGRWGESVFFDKKFLERSERGKFAVDRGRR